jgi:hypothetical protein
VYREVFETTAEDMSFDSPCYASVFANCSLEHMEKLPTVLENVHLSMQRGGIFLLSVVTDKFREWNTMALLGELIANKRTGHRIQEDFLAYHNLRNMLSERKWYDVLEGAGFSVEQYIPLVPEMTSRFFFLLDSIWHLKMGPAEVGELLARYFQRTPNFPLALGGIFESLLQMERDFLHGSGVVFLTRRC